MALDEMGLGFGWNVINEMSVNLLVYTSLLCG